MDAAQLVALVFVFVLSGWFLAAYARMASLKTPYGRDLITVTSTVLILSWMGLFARVWTVLYGHPNYPGRAVVTLVLSWVLVAALAHRLVWFYRPHKPYRGPDRRNGDRRTGR